MAALAESTEDPFAGLVGLEPPRQLAEYLLPPMKRRGVSFDVAWDLAMRSIRWPASRREAREWENMLAATREGWRAAYEGDPMTAQEQAVSGLSAGLARARSLGLDAATGGR